MVVVQILDNAQAQITFLGDTLRRNRPYGGDTLNEKVQWAFNCLIPVPGAYLSSIACFTGESTGSKDA